MLDLISEDHLISSYHKGVKNMVGSGPVGIYTYQGSKGSARTLRPRSNEGASCENKITADGVTISCPKKAEGTLDKVLNFFKKIVDFWSK